MGGTRTWLLAAAVGALATAAVVDAVVGRDPSRGEAGGPPRAGEPVPAGDAASEAEAFLREAGVFGRLVWTDLRCAVHEISLPDLRRVARRGARACALETSPGGAFALEGVPEPEGPLVARCSRGRVEARPPGGPVILGGAGCAPAWTPRGRLTAVREGELVEIRAGGGARPDAAGPVLVSRADLARAFADSPWQFRRPRVREVAWLDEASAVVIVRDGGGSGDVLALFRGHRLGGVTPSPYDGLSRLRTSPRGTYVAARIGEPGGLVVLDREGEFRPLGIRTAHAVAWSHDEVWTAAAARDEVFVFETGDRAVRFARLPIAARDLVWR